MNNVFFSWDGLYFRSYQMTDDMVISDWINDPELNTFFELDSPQTIERMQTSIIRMSESSNDIGLLVFIKNIPIGITEINQIDKIRGKAFVELMIGNKDFTGKGYAQKIIKGVMNYCRCELGLRKLKMNIFEENKSMLRVGYNCGFKKEGILIEEAIKNGVYKNVVVQSAFLQDQISNIGTVLDLVGNTPYISLCSEQWGLQNQVYAKLEMFNPSGSVKDRAALAMIEAAIQDKLISSNTTVIDATSGNLGVSLAMVCAAKGLNLIVVAPQGVIPQSKRDLFNALGGTLIQTPIEYSYEGAIQYAKRLNQELSNSFMVGQFSNINNVRAHKSTAWEIKEKFGLSIDTIIAGLGSGGTLTGLAKEMNRLRHNVDFYAVEPENCTIMGKPPRTEGHYILGIGPGFKPEIFEPELMNGVITVTDTESVEASMQFAKRTGVYCGISSGAVIAAAKKYCEKHKDKRILIILADGGIGYSGKEGFYNDTIYQIFKEEYRNKIISKCEFDNMALNGK